MPIEPQDALWIAGRTLLGALFVVGGLRHCFHFPLLTQLIARRGVPAATFVLLTGTALQIAAGAALIVGFHLVWTTVVLIVFTLTASAIFLNFWSMEGLDRSNAVNALWSNIGIIGGLLVVAAHDLSASAL